VSSCLSFAQTYLFASAGERIVADLRRRVFEALLRQEIAFFDVSRTQELTSRLGSDTAQVADAATTLVVGALRQVLVIVGGLGYLCTVSLRLTLLMGVVVPVLAVFARLFGRWSKEQAKKTRQALAEATQSAGEAMANIRTVRSFAMERRCEDSFSTKVEEVLKLGLRASAIFGLFFGLSELVLSLALAGILYYGGTLVVEGSLSVGVLTSFLLYAMRVGGAVAGLAGIFTSLMSAVGATERVYQLLDREPFVPVDAGLPTDALVGALEFRDVSFTYPSRPGAKVLQNFSVKIDAGKVTALVGSSGAGKSTVISLLERFYDVDSGDLLVDGRALRLLSGASFRKHVGLVLQEPALFGVSIRDNIAFANPSASDAAVERAARAAHAHDFIVSFPEGYRTIVGERGVRLSGGQKQRVAIARALLQDPKVLLLDEASSALDAESEHLVQAALERLMVGRTTVVVAHRLSTVRSAHKIVLVERGRAAAEGSHEALLASSPLYAALVRRQVESGAGLGLGLGEATGAEQSARGDGDGDGNGGGDGAEGAGRRGADADTGGSGEGAGPSSGAEAAVEAAVEAVDAIEVKVASTEDAPEDEDESERLLAR
jgi:ATP-binding cassette subfamily B protein